MATGRFVLRYRGEGAIPEADVARVRAVPGTRVVDASDRMLLVEADPDRLGALVDDLPGWVMGPEQTYMVPDTRKQVEGPPKEQG